MRGTWGLYRACRRAVGESERDGSRGLGDQGGGSIRAQDIESGISAPVHSGVLFRCDGLVDQYVAHILCLLHDPAPDLVIIAKTFGYSHSSGKQDPEVPARGQFMVGDDGEGGNPMKFAVTPGVALELGFMKLFWSADQLELDGLDQDPPFGDDEAQVVGSGSRKVIIGERKEVKDWGTVLVTLVQRA